MARQDLITLLHRYDRDLLRKELDLLRKWTLEKVKLPYYYMDDDVDEGERMRAEIGEHNKVLNQRYPFPEVS